EVTPTEEPTPEVTPTAEPTPEVTPIAEPTPEATPTAEPTPEVTPTAEPTPEATPTAEPTGEPSLIPGTMEYYVNKRGELEEEIRNLQSQLEGAEGRLATASSNLAVAQGKVADAEAMLAELEALPTLEEAQRAVNSANTALAQARKSLTTQQQADNVQDLRDSDTRKDLDEDIEELQEKIDTIKKNAEIIEIKAPADGFAYNITVRSGDALQEKAELLQLVAFDTDYTVEFKFSSEAARSMQVGSELEVNDYFIDKCIIKKIVPDAENPREQMSVICAVTGDALYPDLQVTAVAGKSNKDYEMVVPASAVYEDNSGMFVYVVDESSTPLGDKLVVRKVTVTQEETDGSRTAIKGDGIDKDALIVVRSDKPLNNGDRVRREDYSDKE
ncbi:MAG: HlyD family efflux transporter periplasmic adaptor subunit, partial [Clostridia bacterium]|nr:HlyD family efflux transporter periplasmic adaptor subunit [Clostridia bacterium]